jgi:hypothetical protein
LWLALTSIPLAILSSTVPTTPNLLSMINYDIAFTPFFVISPPSLLSNASGNATYAMKVAGQVSLGNMWN